MALRGTKKTPFKVDLPTKLKLISESHGEIIQSEHSSPIFPCIKEFRKISNNRSDVFV
jgi:hypothetical protein